MIEYSTPILYQFHLILLTPSSWPLSHPSFSPASPRKLEGSGQCLICVYIIVSTFCQGCRCLHGRVENFQLRADS